MTTNPETAGVEPVACPFCRGEFPPVPAQDKAGHMVICTGCSALGPTRNTETLAIAAWNTRAHSPAAREDGEVVCEACDKPCHEDRLHVDGNGFMACAAAFTDDGSGDCPNEVCAPSDSAPIFDGVNLETVIATSLASGNDVQPYEVAMAIRAALATTRPAPEQAPDHANCAVGEGEPTPEPTPQQGLVDVLKAAVADMTPEQKSALADGYVVDVQAMAALNAMSAAIRAETTAQIVAWCREAAATYVGHNMVPHGEVYSELAEALASGDHLTGGGDA